MRKAQYSHILAGILSLTLPLMCGQEGQARRAYATSDYDEASFAAPAPRPKVRKARRVVRSKPKKVETPVPAPVATPPEVSDVVKPEATKVEPVESKPVKSEPVKPEPVKPEPDKAEPVAPEPAKVEPAKSEPVKLEAPPIAEQDIPALLEKCESSCRMQDYGAVEEHLSQLKHDDLNGLELNQVAALYNQMGRTREAAQTITRALKKSPEDAGVVTHAVEYLAADGQYKQALKLGEEFNERNKNKNVAHAMAMAQARNGDVAGALETIDQGFATSGGHEKTEVKGEILNSAGEYGEALAIYQDLAKQTPSEAFYPSTSAELLRKLGRSAEALEACDAALEIAKKDPWLLACRVRILVDLKRYSQAHETAGDLLKGAPLDPANYLVAASVYEAERKFKPALDLVNKGIQKLGSSLELKEAQLRELRNLEKDEQAYSELDKALKANPSMLLKRLKLRFLLADGRLEEAKKLADDIERLNPGSINTLQMRALMLMAEGHYGKAGEQLEQGLKLMSAGDSRRGDFEILTVVTYQLAQNYGRSLEKGKAYLKSEQGKVEGAWPCLLLQALTDRADVKVILTKSWEDRHTIDQLAAAKIYFGLATIGSGKSLEGKQIIVDGISTAQPACNEALMASSLLGNLSRLSGGSSNTLLGLLPLLAAGLCIAGGIVLVVVFMRRKPEQKLSSFFSKDDELNNNIQLESAQEPGSDDPYEATRKTVPSQPVFNSAPRFEQISNKPLPNKQIVHLSESDQIDDLEHTVLSQSGNQADVANILGPEILGGSVQDQAAKPPMPYFSGGTPKWEMPGRRREAAPENEDPSIVEIPPSIKEEAGPDISAARRKYFSSFGNSAQTVEQIWNGRLAKLSTEDDVFARTLGGKHKHGPESGKFKVHQFRPRWPGQLSESGSEAALDTLKESEAQAGDAHSLPPGLYPALASSPAQTPKNPQGGYGHVPDPGHYGNPQNAPPERPQAPSTPPSFIPEPFKKGDEEG